MHSKADVNMRSVFWIQTVGIVLAGSVGSILFKFGVDRYHGINLIDPFELVRFVFSPYIFLSLALFMLGRVLMSLPLQSVDVGKYMFILTPLTLVATLGLSSLVLKESVNMKQMAGIALSLMGVYLLGF